MIAHCGVLSFLSISSVKSLAHLSLPIRWGLIREIRFSHRLKVCVNINISTAVTPNPPSSSSGPHQTNQLKFSPRPAHSTHFQKHQAIPKGMTSTDDECKVFLARIRSAKPTNKAEWEDIFLHASMGMPKIQHQVRTK